MDNNQPAYPPYGNYGYPPPPNQPYPPPNHGQYPPSPVSGPYGYPQYPQYPPPPPQPYGSYPYPQAPPPEQSSPAAPPHSGSPFEYGRQSGSHSGHLSYPYPPEPQYPHYGSSNSFQSVPSGVYEHSVSGIHRQDSLQSSPSMSYHHDHHVSHSGSTYPPVYPPVDELLANVHLSNNSPTAPASPPAPAAHSVLDGPQKFHSFHSGPLPVGAQGGIYAFPNHSFSGSSPRPAMYDIPQSPNLQIVPVPAPKGSLKVLLLHGNLDIWVYEAKNLPNMDMFHKTLGDMFNRLPAKIEGQLNPKITSDPYVSIVVAGATIGRTYVISNSENPVWMQHFNVPVAHSVAEVHFVVKDNDVVGTQLIGTVAIPVEHIYGGGKVEGYFPILGTNGKPCKAGAALSVSVQYTPIQRLSIYHVGVGAGPDYHGVPGTYFPLRRGGTVTLYQDAHVPDGFLPNLILENGMHYVHGKCWNDMFDAIRKARRLVYIAGWSVWHKVRLIRDGEPHPSHTLGELLRSKSQEGVRVLLLVWDDPTSRSILGYKTDGVMATHDEETRRFFKHSSVQVLLCSRVAGKRHSWYRQQEVGVIYTHHQKTVIVDADAGNNKRRIVAFVGGLDLCDGRYDTPQHSVFRTLKTTHADDYHNPTYVGNTAGCPREPWHDLHSKIDGPAAYDVLANFEERWLKASKPQGIRKLKMTYDDALLRIERLSDILPASDSPCINDGNPECWHVQIFRSIDSNSVKGFPKDPKEATMKNLVCGKNVLIDMSIHTAYVKAIRAAQHFIYIENQYFIGSSYSWSQHKDLGANNLIPMEIALKIADKIRTHERFAVYVVIPMWPEGNPTGAATQRILFWQNKTMQMMYETIYKALVEVGLEDTYQPQDFLNFYCLGNREAPDPNESTNDNGPANTPQAMSRKSRRFMIYVHSKGMIVDDEFVIIGSANINQRSMEGSRDTEIAMGAYQPYHTWARNQASPHGQIYGYRMSLWAEHLGIIEDCFTEPDSLECVRRVKAMGEMNWKQYAAPEATDMRGHLMKYPVEVDRTGKVKPLSGHETFPDVGGNIVGSFIAIQENLTI